MTKWTFEISWPAPYKPDWQRSKKLDLTAEGAANRMADYLAISAENGTILTARLVCLHGQALLEAEAEAE